MKNRWIIASLVPLLLACAVPCMAAGSGVYIRSRDEPVRQSAVVKEAAARDAVFFGEFHDSAAIHEAELSFLKELYRETGNRLILSLEMVESDCQLVLTNYLQGKIPEKEFLSLSRPWPNYVDAYRPLIEFAKEKGIPVIAANIPRRIASAEARTGSLDSVAPEDRQYLPQDLEPLTGAYRSKFAAAMREQNGKMKIPEAKIDAFYRAQCLKDAAMAERIEEGRKRIPDAVVLHITGAFHSDEGLGTAAYLSRHHPDLSIYIISPFKGSAAAYQQQNHKTGNVILCVKK